jgi:hypothetical protein
MRMLKLSLALTLPVTCASAQDASPILPSIATATPAPLIGRWDYYPIAAPDRLPEDLVVDQLDRVWLATSGRVLRLNETSVLPVDRWADHEGDSDLPSLIAHDLFELNDSSLLLSTIWAEIYHVTDQGLREILPRDIRMSYSFERLPDGHVAIGLDDYRWPHQDLLDTRLEPLLGGAPLRVAGVKFLAVAHKQLYAVAGNTIVEVDHATGGIRALADLNLGNGWVVDFEGTPEGELFVAAIRHPEGGGCYRIEPSKPNAVERFHEGACFDILPVAPNDIWVSAAEGVYRFNGSVWRQVFRQDSGGIGKRAKFARDDAGNLWAATELGLWRYYDYVREVPLPAGAGSGEPQVNALERASNDALVIGLADGRALRLHEGHVEVALQAPLDKPSSRTGEFSYDRGPVLALDANGSVWALTRHGLYRSLEKKLERVGPGLDSPSPRAPSALAICRDGQVFAGEIWSATVLRRVAHGWQPAYQLSAPTGDSSIADLKCDAEGRAWALGSESVAVGLPNTGEWYESSRFPLRSSAKRNLFGALAVDDVADTVTAWGSWGYPVQLSWSDNRLRESPQLGKMAETDPYVFRKAEALTNGVQLVLTDLGLMAWRNTRLSRLPILDESLQVNANAFLADLGHLSHHIFPELIASGSSLFRVNLPNKSPHLDLITRIPEPLDKPWVTLNFERRVPVGPPEESWIQVTVSPALNDKTEHNLGAIPRMPATQLSLTDLESGQTYVLSAHITDAIGQTSKPVTASLHYERPWREDPRFWVILTFLGFGIVGVLLSRRGPTDFILRRVAGRQWQLVSDVPKQRLTIDVTPEGQLVGELSVLGAPLRARDAKKVDPLILNELREHLRKLSGATQDSNQDHGLARFTDELSTLRETLDSMLTEHVRFALQLQGEPDLQLEVARSLSDLPWDLLSGSGGYPLAISSAPARVVVSDRPAPPPRINGGLRALVYAAPDGLEIPAAWRRERDLVAHALRKAGVADVAIAGPDTPKDELLAALVDSDLAHFIGHAAVDGNGGARARLLIGGGENLSSEDVAQQLTNASRSPSLVFLNVCGSTEEQLDQGGAALAGLATPFLEHGALVVGTQWSVQTAFATELAVDVYRRTLPPPNALLWRWVIRRPLAGVPIAEALARARTKLFDRRPYTDPTWSAYVMFGDATAYLALR